jgi:GxxExxY protein
MLTSIPNTARSACIRKIRGDADEQGASKMAMNESPVERDPQTYAIIGACMAVHNELGPGFLEAVYQEALEIEFTRRGIPFIREKRLVITYGGERLKTPYDADFFCYDSIIVELKAVSGLIPKHEAQTVHYLKATGCERGLLVNFGTPSLDYRRYVFTHPPGKSPQISQLSAD